MATVRYSRRAEADLVGIAVYTRGMWGDAQVDVYLSQLEECCLKLAENPSLGRACDELSPGLRRMETGRHVLFYRQKKNGIVVVRVLHQAMMPRRWKLE